MRHFTIVSILALLVGCGQVADDPAARIVVGESIEGLRIGDNSERVIRLFGEPDATLFGDGNFAEFVYGDRGMAVLVAAGALDSESERKVARVEVEAPYDGTTIDGVGIGSSRSSVRSLLGQPSETGMYAGFTTEIYPDGETFFWFYYDDETLAKVAMKNYY